MSSTDYGCLLTEIALTNGIDWSLRQLAAVLLKQYILVHWKSDYEKFQEPEVNPVNKKIIRNAVLASLSGNEDLIGPAKKVKSLMAVVVYSIGRYDWPEEWPELMPVLLSYLSSNNRSAIYSSMKVLVEMTHELTESQVPSMVPLVMPQMLDILRSRGDLRTRSRAVQVYTFMVETIALLKELDKNAVKNLLDPLLPHFLQTFVHLLQEDVDQENMDIGLKKEIMACLTVLVKNFRQRLLKSMSDILPVVWNNLTTMAVVYVNTEVNGEATGEEVAVDSDGDSLGLDAYIFALFEFVSVLIEHHKTRKLLKQSMTDVLYYVLIYMQITDEQMEVWSSDAAKFVEDEDDESYSFSVRISGQDLLISLSQEIETEESIEHLDAFHQNLLDAVKRHFLESNHVKIAQGSDKKWWKIQEACLFALGSLSESFVKVVKDNRSPSSDLKSLLDNVFLGIESNTPSNTFFSGRCLWTAARFTPIMSPAVIDRFLALTVSAYSSPCHVIKIFATKAVFSFSSHLKDMKQQQLMSPYLESIVDGLVSVGSQYHDDVLVLVLETMVIISTIDSEFTGSHEHKFSPLAVDSFLRNSGDPVMVMTCQDLFKELSKNAKCVSSLQSRLAPTLHSILDQQSNIAEESRKSLEPACLDILTSLVKWSPLPLSDILMQLFPSTVNCVLRTEDNSTLENGGQCIRAYVSRSPEQIMSSSQGSSMVLDVCLHLLDPRVSESPFIGSLISTVIVKAGGLLGSSNIHLLLKSVVSKLVSSETLTVIQSLILVFAHLIHHDMKTVLDFLSSIPSPSSGSKSALEFILSLWLGRQHIFFGHYDRKVSILALGKLLEHSVMLITNGSENNNLNLNTIMVPGDPIIEETEKIVTRSQTKIVKKNVSSWTQVPSSVKILKVLTNEIATMLEEQDNEDSYDEEDDDDDGIGSEGDVHVINLSTGSAGHGSTHSVSSEEPDSDLDENEANDPIRKVDLDAFLTNFMKSFGETAVFAQFLVQLNDNERQTLAKLQQ